MAVPQEHVRFQCDFAQGNADVSPRLVLPWLQLLCLFVLTCLVHPYLSSTNPPSGLSFVPEVKIAFSHLMFYAIFVSIQVILGVRRFADDG